MTCYHRSPLPPAANSKNSQCSDSFSNMSHWLHGLTFSLLAVQITIWVSFAIPITRHPSPCPRCLSCGRLCSRLIQRWVCDLHSPGPRLACSTVHIAWLAAPARLAKRHVAMVKRGQGHCWMGLVSLSSWMHLHWPSHSQKCLMRPSTRSILLYGFRCS